MVFRKGSLAGGGGGAGGRTRKANIFFESLGIVRVCRTP